MANEEKAELTAAVKKQPSYDSHQRMPRLLQSLREDNRPPSKYREAFSVPISGRGTPTRRKVKLRNQNSFKMLAERKFCSRIIRYKACGGTNASGRSGLRSCVLLDSIRHER
ncbi:uncharacterized protein LOC143217149 isoform X2 [Lasioglossum baleicum]|uniref:uncharacterized protein LOC143217149 isoform X2 n=1 Tax=Lasioglossum baleicum TaxID=434251 RepID=UPI003FCE59D6